MSKTSPVSAAEKALNLADEAPNLLCFPPMVVRYFVSLFLSFFLASAAFAGGPVYDVVFDLDWTLFYPLKNQQTAESVHFGQAYYQPADHVAEVLIKLHQDGHRVSLFSGGDRERNAALAESLLAQMKARGVHDFSFYKILNFGDLTPRRDAGPNSKFAERYMKDLRKVNRDLSRVILVDDIATFMVPGQEKNLHWLGKTYTFLKDFTAASGNPYDPPTEQEWTRERNKIGDFYRVFQETITAGLCSKAFALAL